MNFIMIGLLLREALDRLRVRLNMYLALIKYQNESDREENERASKIEVSRQLVYMLGGQSEPDGHRSSGLQRTDYSGIK